MIYGSNSNLTLFLLIRLDKDKVGSTDPRATSGPKMILRRYASPDGARVK